MAKLSRRRERKDEGEGTMEREGKGAMGRRGWEGKVRARARWEGEGWNARAWARWERKGGNARAGR